MHGQAGRLEACRCPALLHLQVVGQTEHIFLDRGKTHKIVQLSADLIHCAGILGGQQGEQLALRPVVQPEPHAVRLCGQADRAGKLYIGLQAVFAQGAENAAAGFRQSGRALFLRALGSHIVPHIRPGGKGQAEAGAHLLGQSVQLLRRQRGKVLTGKGCSCTHIAHSCHKRCAEFIRQRVPALAGEEDEVLAAGGDAAHGTRGKRRAGIHQNALFIHQIPAGKGRTAPDREVRQRLEEARVAAFVMLKDHDLAGGVEGGIQIL